MTQATVRVHWRTSFFDCCEKHGMELLIMLGRKKMTNVRVEKCEIKTPCASCLVNQRKALEEIRAILQAGSFGDGKWQPLSPQFRKDLFQIADKALKS